MKSSVIFATLSLCFVAASAQIIIPAPCQDTTIEQEFDLPAYLGKWYEYKRYFTFFQLNGKCVSATYSDNMNGTIEVRNYLVNSNTNEVETIVGSARQNSDTGEGKLLVNFPTTGDDESDYWVLDTDYVSFSVVWSCANSGGQSLQTAWLLTRERVPSVETLAAAEAVITENGLNAGTFLITDQTDCPPDEF